MVDEMKDDEEFDQLMKGLDSEATHNQVSRFLLDGLGSILNKENLLKFYRFRNQIADVFGLMDTDNDKRLFWHSNEM